MNARILRSVSEIDAGVWDALASDPVFSHGWFRALEGTAQLDVEPRHIVLEDEGGNVRGILPCFVQGSDPFGSVRDRLFGRLQGALRAPFGQRVLVAYAPLAQKTKLLLAEGVDEAAAIARCNAAMSEVCREEDIAMSAWGFVDWQDESRTRSLVEGGYQRVHLGGAARFENRYPTFADYLADIARQGRRRGRDLRYELRCLERSGMRIETLPLSELSAAELESGQRTHYRRYHPRGDTPFTASLFEAIARELGDRAVVHAAYEGDRLVSYSLVLTGDESWHMSVSGDLDEEAAHRDKLHFNLNYYHPMKEAIEAGASGLDYGLSNYEAKLKRGCSLSPVALWVRAHGRSRATALRVWCRAVDAHYRRKDRDVPIRFGVPQRLVAGILHDPAPLWQRALNRVHEDRSFLVTSILLTPDRAVPVLPEGCTTRFLSADELLGLAATTSRTNGELLRHYAAADDCFTMGVLEGEEILGYQAITFGDVANGGAFFPHVRLRHDEAWIGYAWVNPRARGRRVSGVMREAAMTELARRGIRAVFSVAYDQNAAPLRSILNSDFGFVRVWRYRKLGPFVWRTATDLPPDHPVVELVRERRPSGEDMSGLRRPLPEPDCWKA